MSSSYPLPLPALLLLLCFCSVFSNSQISNQKSSDALSLPIFKHPVSGQYVAQISRGTTRRPVKLVVDLGGPFTGVDCRQSSTHRSVPFPSLECSKAGGSGSSVAERGELVEDLVTVGSYVVEGQVADSVLGVDRFLFHCMPRSALRRLSPTGGVNGVVGLGRSRMSLPHQFSMAHLLDRKFALCLSASGGQLLIGDALSRTEISKSLIYTPLITSGDDSSSHQHLVSVDSMRIEGEPGVVKVNGRARLSTTAPHTILQSSIYQAFTEKYIKAVANATRAESVWPFKTCFATENGGSDDLPAVDLVLQSKMVKWRIGGRNLMVEVKGGVRCLGMLDGGYDMADEIVIGSHQLEENLLEFDMARSMLGLSSSLVNRGTSCADLKLESGWTRQQHASS
uniref:Peptidase A1 domain-containing protein n=1 Tax=Kalanchoe fedtschenkoi TaxID=63787 RepID=A0A7N0UL76_KALFE